VPFALLETSPPLCFTESEFARVQSSAMSAAVPTRLL
jgi:hypothetical protein